MLVADITAGPPDLAAVTMGVLGGLALFLFGLDQMSDALKLIAGDGLKMVLARLTTNRFTAVLAGTFVTAIIQSSSVTTVLVIGFISAGLMTLTQSMGVILGADIGTTITAQIVAFKITQYALLLVALGFALQFGFRHERVKHYGHMIMGLGLIFFGMQLMSEGTGPLRSFPPFLHLMLHMRSPMLGILVAAVFTAVIQSSSATMGIVITLASQGLITVEAGIALAFGANIGTCATALLAAIGKPREAIRAAVVHVMFKVVGVMVWYPFTAQLSEFVVWLSPAYPDLQGIDRLAAEAPRQIANAHTVFNVANAALFIWFTGPLSWLLQRIVPERARTLPETARPRYLDHLLLRTPSLALDVARLELSRLGTAALRMVRSALRIVMHGTHSQLVGLEQMDNDVDELHAAIVTYLATLSQQNLTQSQSRLLRDYLAVANYLESIGDMVETNFVNVGRQRLREHLQISKPTEDALESLHHRVAWSVERAVRALVDNDAEVAAEVLEMKDEINRLTESVEVHLSRRLAAAEPKRLAAFKLESEIMEYLKRVYYFAKRIAKVVSEADQLGEERPEEEASKTPAVSPSESMDDVTKAS